MNSILILPAYEKGRGGGHLYRSILLAKALRAGGADAWLFAEPADLICNSHKATINAPGSDLKCTTSAKTLWLDKEIVHKKKWTLIILDHFRTEQKIVQSWAALGPVLGIDEGLSRKECDFLIDLLPNLYSAKKDKKPNLCAPSLLPLPKKQRSSFTMQEKAGSRKILVSFGAEDPANLTVRIALALKNITGPDFSTSVVLGPIRNNSNTDREILEQAGIAVIKGAAPPAENMVNPDTIEPASFCLQEIISDYDLIITHFGVTAFEALHARVPVLLINPGSYHEKLSRHAGFPYISKKNSMVFLHKNAETQSFIQSSKTIHTSLRLSAEGTNKEIDFDELFKKCAELSEKAACRWGLNSEKSPMPQKPETLSGLLLAVKPVIHRQCPLCSAPAGRPAGRFPDRTYRFCHCGTIIMDRLTTPPVEYNQDYFFTEYKKQYGKTYLEDFPKLQKDGLRRIHIISTLLDLKHNAPNCASPIRNAPKVLDIGCAYGPFLSAAQNSGFEVMGIDPAPDAVNYVRNTLGINAVQGTFPESIQELTSIQDKTNETGKNRQFYDVITLWYVIEHFKDPGKILTLINNLLEPGGVIAFSTPSAAGISRYKSLHKFLENSPADHWTIVDPRYIKRILTRYGFQLKKRVLTGHHSERFPLSKILPGSIGDRIFNTISKVFGLGDTFEGYAVKVRNCVHV